jgi:hypothetical protein
VNDTLFSWASDLTPAAPDCYTYSNRPIGERTSSSDVANSSFIAALRGPRQTLRLDELHQKGLRVRDSKPNRSSATPLHTLPHSDPATASAARRSVSCFCCADARAPSCPQVMSLGHDRGHHGSSLDSDSWLNRRRSRSRDRERFDHCGRQTRAARAGGGVQP